MARHFPIGARACTLTIFTGLVMSSLAAPRADTPMVPADGLRAVLSARAAATDAQWMELQQGAPVALVADGTAPTEISAIGAIRLLVPASTFVGRFRTIEQLETGKNVLQVGRFSRTPRLEDVRALTLDAGDIPLLRSCKPRDCGLQLPSSVMNAVRSAATEGPDAANRAIRGFLVDLVHAYRQTGSTALGQYDDKREPMPLGSGFEAMLSIPHAVPAAQPEVAAFFRAYPQAATGRVEDFFYWTKIAFGLRPTIRVNHVAIVPLTGRADGLRYLIVSRQLWASHYFDTALEARLLADDPARPARGSYLVYSTTVRSRSLGGLLGAMVRGKVRRQARTALESYLVRTKELLERLPALTPSPSPPVLPATASPRTLLRSH